MLKQSTALFLLLAMMATTFTKAVIVVDFYANQDYIAKNLCINRDKPRMNCAGKCQLCKRLDREDNQEKNMPERKQENRSEVVFCEGQSAYLLSPAATPLSSSYPVLTAGTPVSRARSIFHPPGC
ncbi:MAG TPA: hypothetical protein VI233_00885 [Puia sp.]